MTPEQISSSNNDKINAALGMIAYAQNRIKAAFEESYDQLVDAQNLLCTLKHLDRDENGKKTAKSSKTY